MVVRSPQVSLAYFSSETYQMNVLTVLFVDQKGARFCSQVTNEATVRISSNVPVLFSVHIVFSMGLAAPCD